MSVIERKADYIIINRRERSQSRGGDYNAFYNLLGSLLVVLERWKVRDGFAHDQRTEKRESLESEIIIS